MFTESLCLVARHERFDGPSISRNATTPATSPRTTTGAWKANSWLANAVMLRHRDPLLNLGLLALL